MAVAGETRFTVWDVLWHTNYDGSRVWSIPVPDTVTDTWDYIKDVIFERTGHQPIDFKVTPPKA